MTPDLLYLDAAATTPVAAEVAAAMQAALRERAGAQVDVARADIARLLGVAPDALRLASGGTEANNLALRAAAARLGARRLVSQPTEHPSVDASLRALSGREGLPLEWLPVDRDGRVDPGDLRRALLAGPGPCLVAVMHGNNETGVLQPVAALAAEVRAAGGWLHVDAVQSARHLDVAPGALGADLVVVTGHKLDGPKGVAAVAAGERARLALAGWSSAGPGPALALGLRAALARRARLRAEGEAEAVARSRDALEAAVLAGCPAVRVTGAGAPRLPGHVSLLVDGLSGEALVQALDLLGIAASTGAACATGDPAPSRVLLALGRTPAEARGALRLSLLAPLPPADVARAARAVICAVARLRSLSGLDPA